MARTRDRRADRHRHDTLGERLAPWIAMVLAFTAWISALLRTRVAPAVLRGARLLVAAALAAALVAARALGAGVAWVAGALRVGVPWLRWHVRSWGAVAARGVVRAARSTPRLADIARTRTARRAGALAAWLLLAGGSLAYGMGPALAVAAAVAADDVDDGRALSPLEQRSVIVAADGSQLATLHEGINRRVVPLTQIPQHVRHAVISAEDRRFWEHDGYDFEAIGRAALANLQARTVSQGASTITQQIAKANFTDGDRTFRRKWTELVHAVALERELTKVEILERYLNEVYFGSGAYGIAAAAEELFRVAPQDLSVPQAALLAGLIRSPGSLSPRDRPRAAVQRRNTVLRAMAEEGYLSSDEARRHSGAKLGVASPPAAKVRSRVVEAVKREFLSTSVFGETRRERERLLYTGGVRVSTSIRPRLQKVAADTVVQQTSGLGITGAVAAVDPRTGRVLALYGGRRPRAQQFDLATQGRRQPGSAFKPFVAAAALSAGLSPAQPLEGDGPVVVDMPGSQQPWHVDNYESADHGDVRIAEAMAASVNTAFAQIAAAVGTGQVAQVAARLGIDVPSALGPKDTRGPAMALGGVTHGVTPLEMASAYGAFATSGTHVRAHLITEVTGHDGRSVYRAPEERKRVLPEGVTAHVRDMLRAVIDEGTGIEAGLSSWDAVGKTGTTQNNADAWFVGTTPIVSAAVWAGHPDGQRPVPGLTGGTLPAAMWRTFMEAALERGEPRPFPDLSTTLPADAPLTLPAVRHADDG